jgi:hypothetical protein
MFCCFGGRKPRVPRISSCIGGELDPESVEDSLLDLQDHKASIYVQISCIRTGEESVPDPPLLACAWLY